MAIVTRNDSLARGISQAGSALAGSLSGYLEKRAATRLGQQQQNILSSALENADLSTQQGQQSFLQEIISQGGNPDAALGILDRAIKQQSAAKVGFESADPSELSGLFKRLGVDATVADDYAELYGTLSQGGRTSFANMFIDKLQRGEYGKGARANAENAMKPIGEFEDSGDLEPLGEFDKNAQIEELSKKPLSDVEPEEEAFVFPKLELFQGLTPKEKVMREKELFNANAKDFNEVSKKIKGAKDDSFRIDQLKRYNESGKLPEGMQKLNINWANGDIRVPSLANPETQAFVKTINDFTIKAKDTFGARVTNFELGSFMRRLPTLANSTEGRRMIIEQMKLMGELDKLYYDSLSEVYDKYGLRGIDSQKAEKIASDLRSAKEEALKARAGDILETQNIHEEKSRLPENHVLIEFNGKRGAVPQSQVDVAISKGARVL